MPRAYTLSNAILTPVFSNSGFTIGSLTPTSLYLALGTSATPPVAAGTGHTEPTIGVSNYSRVQLTSSFSSGPTGGVLTNDVAAIPFPTASGSWGTIRYVLVYDAATGGNFWWWGQLAADVPVGSSQTFQIPISSFTIIST